MKCPKCNPPVELLQSENQYGCPECKNLFSEDGSSEVSSGISETPQQRIEVETVATGIENDLVLLSMAGALFVLKPDYATKVAKSLIKEVKTINSTKES